MTGIRTFAVAAGIATGAPLLAAAATPERPAGGGVRRHELVRGITYAEIGAGALAATAGALWLHIPHSGAVGLGAIAGGLIANRIAGGAINVIDRI